MVVAPGRIRVLLWGGSSGAEFRIVDLTGAGAEVFALRIELEAQSSEELHRAAEVLTGRLTKILRAFFWSHGWLLLETSACTAHGQQRLKAPIAQPKPDPEQRGDVEREQDVAEERAADAHVGRDGSAEIAGPEHRAEHGGARHEIQRQADELDHASAS